MAVSGSIAAAVAGPMLMMIVVIFYDERRIEKEAFDLQQMIASLPEPNSAKSISLA